MFYLAECIKVYDEYDQLGNDYGKDPGGQIQSPANRVPIFHAPASGPGHAAIYVPI
jgi:hypothetical protein